MAAENHPIYMVGGSKGGVGKSFVTLALVDYLRRSDIHVVLVETDTSNPDVMKAVHDEVECASCDLDEAGGWIDFVNFCDSHRDATVVVNTAARSQTGVAQYGGTLAGTLDELARRLVVLWVINRQRDSLELLTEFGETFPVWVKGDCAYYRAGARCRRGGGRAREYATRGTNWIAKMNVTFSANADIRSSSIVRQLQVVLLSFGSP